MKETYEFEYDAQQSLGVVNILKVKWKVTLKDGEDVIEKLIDNWDFSLLKKAAITFKYREPILKESLFGSVIKGVTISTDLANEYDAKRFLKKVRKVAKKYEDSIVANEFVTKAFYELAGNLRKELKDTYEPVIKISPAYSSVSEKGFQIHRTITHNDKLVNIDAVYNFLIDDSEYKFLKNFKDVNSYRYCAKWVIDGKDFDSSSRDVVNIRKAITAIHLSSNQVEKLIEMNQSAVKECWQLLRASKDPIGPYKSFKIKSASKAEMKILLYFEKATLNLNLTKAPIEDTWNWEFQNPEGILPKRDISLFGVKDFYSLTSYLTYTLGMGASAVNSLKDAILKKLPTDSKEKVVTWSYKTHNLTKEIYIYASFKEDLVQKVVQKAYELTNNREDFSTHLISNLRGSFEILIMEDFKKTFQLFIDDTTFYPKDFERYYEIPGDTALFYRAFTEEMTSRFWDETKIKEEAIY